MANVLESAASGTGLEAELRPGQFTIPSHAHTFCSLSTFLLLNLAAHWHRPMSYSDKPWGNYQNIFQSQLSQFSDAPTLFLVPWRFTQSVLFLMNNFCSVNYVELCLFYFFFSFRLPSKCLQLTKTHAHKRKKRSCSHHLEVWPDRGDTGRLLGPWRGCSLIMNIQFHFSSHRVHNPFPPMMSSLYSQSLSKMHAEKLEVGETAAKRAILSFIYVGFYVPILQECAPLSLCYDFSRINNQFRWIKQQ